MITCFAHRVQRPWEKINHALVLGGLQGIGKDTILEPVAYVFNGDRRLVGESGADFKWLLRGEQAQCEWRLLRANPCATRSLGDRVEIRIRDNGTGMPLEVKEKIFNPFFTTKPAGEGTGLGLSISHDIIVKQHGGSIEVDTQPGEFTEFTIILPRAAVFLAERA